MVGHDAKYAGGAAGPCYFEKGVLEEKVHRRVYLLQIRGTVSLAEQDVPTHQSKSSDQYR